MLTEARPVRILDISCCRSVTAFSIRLLAFASISLIELNGVAALGAGGSVFIKAKCAGCFIQCRTGTATGTYNPAESKAMTTGSVYQRFGSRLVTYAKSSELLGVT